MRQGYKSIWHPEDVRDAAEAMDREMTLDEAQEWLDKHWSVIGDLLTERGNEAINDLLAWEKAD